MLTTTDMAFFHITVGAGVLVLSALVVSALGDPSAEESLFIMVMLGVSALLMGGGAWELFSGKAPPARTQT